jgi:hypothetical protein
MSFWERFRGKSGNNADRQSGRDELKLVGQKSLGNHDGLDRELDEVLGDFRNSVHAWSEAEYSRPRKALETISRVRNWRLASGLALGCALLVGGVSGGVYEQHRRQQQKKIAVVLREADSQRQQVEQQSKNQRQIAARPVQEEEDLLAKVDSDVAREVPSAMEPLAQLMDEDKTE